MTQDEAFKSWWYNEGSKAPYTHHDCEEHTMRMCEIAWANGAYKAIADLESQNIKQVTVKDFVHMVEGRENLIGRPVCFAQWPNGNTHPPQRTWVRLTDEEISACDPYEECWGLLKIARAIEAKLKDKNL